MRLRLRPSLAALPAAFVAIATVLSSEGQARPDGRALVVVRGRVLDAPGATAVLVRGERIEAVGGDDEVRARAGSGAVVLDAAGGLVLAGFHDAHSHLQGGGLALLQADLEGLPTVEACVEAVRRWAAEHPEAAWIEGRGWSYDLVPNGAFPTRHDLDRAVADRPALLESYDGHSAWANSKALELAGIGAQTPDPPGGRIVREADGKTPQGALLESAAALVAAHVPPPPRAARLRALEAALDHALRHGLTSVTTIAGDPDELELWAELERAGRLPVRIAVALPLGGDLDRWEALRERHRSPWLRTAFLKGFLDGVIESRTAYLLEPYGGAGEPTRGAPLIPPDELRRLVKQATARGFSVGLHAIGDGAIRLALDAYEAAGPRERVRHRLEHLEVIDPADLPRLGRLDVVASMQPYHAVPSDEADEGTDAWSANLGPARLPRAFAWRDLADAGATLAFGSDWPVMTLDPLHGVAVAATRKNERGLPAAGWHPRQRLSAGEALRASSWGSARAIGREAELGRVAPGQLADLVVLSPGVDPDRPESFWRGRVVHVVTGGVLRRTGL